MRQVIFIAHALGALSGRPVACGLREFARDGFVDTVLYGIERKV